MAPKKRKQSAASLANLAAYNAKRKQMAAERRQAAAAGGFQAFSSSDTAPTNALTSQAQGHPPGIEQDEYTDLSAQPEDEGTFDASSDPSNPGPGDQSSILSSNGQDTTLPTDLSSSPVLPGSASPPSGNGTSTGSTRLKIILRLNRNANGQAEVESVEAKPEASVGTDSAGSDWDTVPGGSRNDSESNGQLTEEDCGQEQDGGESEEEDELHSPAPSRGRDKLARKAKTGAKLFETIDDEHVREGEDIYIWYLGPKPHPRLTMDMNTTESINDYLYIKKTSAGYRGVFTKRPVPAGTLLVQERALVSGVPPNLEGRKLNDVLRAKVYALSQAQRQRFLKLCHEPPQIINGARIQEVQSNDNEESRMKCNAFTDDGESWAAWYAISMVNHCCIPNATIDHCSNTAGETPGWNLRAIVFIPKDTEVTINYRPDWEKTDFGTGAKRSIDPVKKRKAEIKKQWGFICACPACVSSKSMRIADVDYATLHQLRVDLKGSKFDTSRRRDVDEYATKLLEYTALLKKYNLTQSLFKAFKTASTFMEKASAGDDMAKSWRAQFAREATDYAIACHGIESVGKSKDGSSGIKGLEYDPDKVKEVAKWAGIVLKSMEVKFEDRSVVYGS